MQIDAVFTNVKAYNIKKLDVILGQKFSLLTDASPLKIQWFANNDAALKITEKDFSCDVETTALGTSYLQIEDPSFNKLDTITINVVDSTTPAVELGLTAEAPVSK